MKNKSCLLALLAVVALAGCDPESKKSSETETEGSTDSGFTTTGDETTVTTAFQEASESSVSSSSSEAVDDSSSSSEGSTGSSEGSSSSTGENLPPVELYSDDFEGDLSDWSLHREEDGLFSLESGELVMTALPNTSWYGENQSLHIYKELPGSRNFMVTTQVAVTSGLLGTYQQSGLLFRTNQEFPSNTYGITMGTGNLEELQVVWLNTFGGVSSWGAEDNIDGTSTIRLCRLGTEVYSLFNNGDGWVVLNSTVRQDMTETLLVGMVTSAISGQADLESRFGSVDFEEISSVADCQN